jgi:hypothetical protein
MADELEVLLAQEREAEQAIERSIARQKTALRRVRFALASVAVVAAGATLFGYTKRQTWRLATELERARAEGATTFDQLDTCVAAHQLSERRGRECSDDQARTREAHRQTLTSLEADSDAVERELNRRLGAATRRAGVCEKAHDDDSQAWGEERSRLTTAIADEKARQTELESTLASSERRATELEQELERQRTARKVCESAAQHSSASRDECREDLAFCIQDRDTCLAPEPQVAGPKSPAAPAPTPASPPAPSKPVGGASGDGTGAASAPRP